MFSVSMRHKLMTAAAAMLACVAAPAGQTSFIPAGANIALNKPYKYSAGNYRYCTDPEDNIQLTDGKYTDRGKGALWVQKEAVGWYRGNECVVSVDLGKSEPICGVSWNTAAGSADVVWPNKILIFTSEDEKNWSYAGDLIELSRKNGLPAKDGYDVFKFATDELKTRGRYVLFFLCTELYGFVDEVEVFRASDENIRVEYDIKSPAEYHWSSVIRKSAEARMMLDLEKIADVGKNIPGLDQAVFQTKADALKKEIRDNDEIYLRQAFKAVYPFNELHRRVLALNADVLQAAGISKPFLWKNNRWDNMSITAIPRQEKLSPLVVEMMRNEVRGESLNICNPTSGPIQCRVEVTGFPEEIGLRLYEVLTTDTKQNLPVSAALCPSPDENAVTFTVPAGCSKQVWLSFGKTAAAPGRYKGRVVVSVPDMQPMETEISLVLHKAVLSVRPTLHVGGFDYLNTQGKYYKAPGAVEANMSVMKEMYVDSPWATAEVMPQGASFDKDGHLASAQALNFSKWDAWIKMWPDARLYCIYLNSGNVFYGEKIGTPRFYTIVGEYMKAWAEHIKNQGIGLDRIVLLTLDEPQRPEHDQTVIQWTKAIKTAVPEFMLFVDPVHKDLGKVTPGLFKYIDIICPHTPDLACGVPHAKELTTAGKARKEFFVNQRKSGHQLWLYSCKTPSKTQDPVAYHRYQAWEAFDMGASGSFYWAFGCGGGIGNSWAAYAQTRDECSPYFVAPDSTMHSKHSIAIMEGVQDYEYLVMLKKSIESLRRQGKNKKAAEKEAVLERAVKSVVENESFDNEWEAVKERSIMDAARLQVLRAL